MAYFKLTLFALMFAFAPASALAIGDGNREAGASADRDAALEAWRARGARPALTAMLKDGALDPGERAIIGVLAETQGQERTIHIDGVGPVRVTPRPADAGLLSALSAGSVDLDALWEEKLDFIRLAMLDDRSWRRLRRYAASRFYEFPDQAARDGVDFGAYVEDWFAASVLLSNDVVFTNEPVELETKYWAKLAYEALDMVAAPASSNVPVDSYAFLRCRFDPSAAC